MLPVCSSVIVGRAAQAASRTLTISANSSAGRLFSTVPSSSCSCQWRCRCGDCTRTARPGTFSKSGCSTPLSSCLSPSLRCSVVSWCVPSRFFSSSLRSAGLSSCASVALVRAFATYKKTTGLVGVPVVENPHEVLTALYEETLKRLSSYPANSPAAMYNADIGKLTAWRLKQVKTYSDVRLLENAIGFGIIEEVITTAERELELIIRLNESSWVADTIAECEEAERANPHWDYDPMPTVDGHNITPQEFSEKIKVAHAAFWKDIDEEIRKEDEEKAKQQQNSTQITDTSKP